MDFKKEVKLKFSWVALCFFAGVGGQMMLLVLNPERVYWLGWYGSYMTIVSVLILAGKWIEEKSVRITYERFGRLVQYVATLLLGAFGVLAFYLGFSHRG